MKDLLLLAVPLLIITTFSSCKRDLELRDDIEVAEGPSHCYDEQLSGDELAIDCGGSCPDCDTPTPSCVTTANKADFGTSTFTINNPNCYFDNDSNHVFEGSFNNGTLTIKTRKFDPTIVYEVNSSIQLYDEAVVEYDSPNQYGSMTSHSGYVYLGSNINGKYAVVCNSGFHSFVTGQDFDFAGEINCN